MPEECKESIIVPSYKKADKTDCSNYRGTSLLPATFKILSSILLSRLIPYTEKTVWKHQCRFRRNSSTTDHILCIRQILEQKWENDEAVYQLFIDSKKAYDSVRREGFYNNLIEFGVHVKPVRPIKMCLNETYSRVQVGKRLCDLFRITDSLKQEDALSSLLFNFVLEYAIRRIR